MELTKNNCLIHFPKILIHRKDFAGLLDFRIFQYLYELTYFKWKETRTAKWKNINKREVNEPNII